MPLTLTPAPGITLEEVQAHMARARKAGMRRPVFPTAGPTARFIKPAPAFGPGFVECPTCFHPVLLSAWWLHGCKRAAPPDAPQRYPSPKRRPEKTWGGDVPKTADCCGAPIQRGFADAPVRGTTWGIMCPMCWELTLCPGVGQYYERRGKRWVRTQSRG